VRQREQLRAAVGEGDDFATDALAGAFPLPAVIQDFWTDVYAELDE
jgi:hypothetical protein